MAHKTVNASPAAYEVLAKVKKDTETDLGISVSLSDAITMAAAAYYELKQIKQQKVIGVTFNSGPSDDVHMFIDGLHDPAVCPECIQPGALSHGTS